MLLPTSVKMGARKRSEYKTVIEDLWALGILSDEQALPLLTGRVAVNMGNNGSPVTSAPAPSGGGTIYSNGYFSSAGASDGSSFSGLSADASGAGKHTVSRGTGTVTVPIGVEKVKAKIPAVKDGDRICYEVSRQSFGTNFVYVLSDEDVAQYTGGTTTEWANIPAFNVILPDDPSSGSTATTLMGVYRISVGIMPKDTFQLLPGSVFTGYFTVVA